VRIASRVLVAAPCLLHHTTHKNLLVRFSPFFGKKGKKSKERGKKGQKRQTKHMKSTCRSLGAGPARPACARPGWQPPGAAGRPRPCSRPQRGPAPQLRAPPQACRGPPAQVQASKKRKGGSGRSMGMQPHLQFGAWGGPAARSKQGSRVAKGRVGLPRSGSDIE
jgi:hypothetical protein